MLNSYVISDIGLRRQANEDCFGSLKTEKFEVFVVCDGMGGHVSGALASSLATESFLEYVKKSSTIDYQKLIEEAIHFANSVIYDKSKVNEENKGMGTTIVVALVSKDKLYFAHVGDSRIYLIQNKKLNQITEDHSFVQKLVNSGVISTNEALVHPRRNEITNALGLRSKIDVSVCEKAIKLNNGDKILLCSDGLTTMLSENEILKVINEKKSIEGQVSELILKSNDAGGYDNITVNIIEVEGIKGDRVRIKKSFLFVLLAILVLGASSILYFTVFNDGKKVPNPQVEKSETPVTKEVEKSEDNLSKSSMSKQIQYDLS